MKKEDKKSNLPWRYRPKYLSIYLWLNNLFKKEDITVVIGVKDRYSFRMINSLKSIRNQDYPQALIKIIIVDYDTKKELIQKFKKMIGKYNANYIRVNNKPLWSRAHAMNIGIKRTTTKYILCSDEDIIFERDYIKRAIKELQKNSFQVILSQCFDLPKIKINKIDFNKFKRLAKPRDIYKRKCAYGINLTLRYFYYKVRGYDEFYKLWGYEDKDLIKRFEMFGLNIKLIKNKSIYFHQWHPKYRGIKIKGYEKQIRKNKEYKNKTNSIIRNKAGWGEIN
ncbi:glycosyltransferase [Candidatus Woesearchaeota archaeon]|nr:glycosyltransferase [Candidatus Woesearchaeota archaeon]